ncbi:uncharacterized protein LOC129303811 [Prosopis cineraria]|uniref:uncharacterized protein LOC129303811 n=1 Tax=Prosopis cineraria TaxID=364024 RepID=UPI00240F3B17|nr:uncharacterized protein LOC129303811 [Prosopis cineraria]
MESVASNSPSPDLHPHHPRFNPNHPISDRILRALRHPLCLLHRSNSNFFVLGTTGNVYTVNLSSTPFCSCPDPTTPCKHVLFVLIRVLGVSLDDVCLRRRTLRPCQLHRLLGIPTLPESLAGATLRQRFHQLSSSGRSLQEGALNQMIEIEEGSTCPVCLEDMGKKEKVVACGTCENPIHEECFVRWKRSRGKRWVRCVICRAKWRDMSEQVKYLNLSSYVIGEGMAGPS